MKTKLPSEEEMIVQLNERPDDFMGLRHVWEQLSLSEKQIMFLTQVKKMSGTEVGYFFLSSVEKKRVEDAIQRIRQSIIFKE